MLGTRAAATANATLRLFICHATFQAAASSTLVSDFAITCLSQFPSSLWDMGPAQSPRRQSRALNEAVDLDGARTGRASRGSAGGKEQDDDPDAGDRGSQTAGVQAAPRAEHYPQLSG